MGAGGIDLCVREPVTDAFWHEAVLYRNGVSGLLDVVVPFVVDGIERGEPVMVAEPPKAIAALEDALGADAGKVTFVDITTLGRNPARIMPEWLRFVDKFGGASPVRGVGEPAYVGRRDVELDECRLHEALLNVAFDSGPAWKLICPYDTSALPAEAIDAALHTHPYVGDPEPVAPMYAGHAYAVEEFTRPLTPPPSDAEEFVFDGADLSGLRSMVRRLCDQESLTEGRRDDVVLAAHELAGNSVQHAGGRGTMCAWRTETALVIEVADAGVIDDLLVGRQPVLDLDESGRGVSIANQLCDLVQVRSSASGTTVRLHTWL